MKASSTEVVWQLWIAEGTDPESAVGPLGTAWHWTVDRDALFGARMIGAATLDQGPPEALWSTLRLARGIAAAWTVDGPFESGASLVVHLKGHQPLPGIRDASIHLVSAPNSERTR